MITYFGDKYIVHIDQLSNYKLFIKLILTNTIYTNASYEIRIFLSKQIILLLDFLFSKAKIEKL